MAASSVVRRTFVLASAGLVIALATPSASFAQDNKADTTVGQELNSKKVTLNLENADIRYALKLLFQSVGANYTLDQNVQGAVTVSLTDVSFRTALESILRGTQSQVPLTYRVENNVYSISPKVEVVDTTTNAPETPDVKPPTTRTVKLQVNFADAIDLATAFGGSVITSRLSNLGGGMGGGFGGGMGGGGFGGGMGGMGGGMGGMGGGFGGGMGGMGGGGFGGGGMGGFGGGGMGGMGGGGFGGGGFGGGGMGGGFR